MIVGFIGKRILPLLLAGAAISFSPSSADARVTLEALRRDGYGMVELERPEPNILAVIATINGRRVRLIVDTGWSDEGITVNGDFAKVLRAAGEAVKDSGRSATGFSLGTFKKGVADIVCLGNVQMRRVPIIFGTIGALQHRSARSLRVDGFIGSGFLSTCSGIIDLHNLRLYLRPPGTGHRVVIGRALRGQGLAEVPFSIVKSNCLVDVEVNGAPGMMFVDTGSTLAGVDERFVPQMKTKARASDVRAVDAAGAEVKTKLTQLRSFRIGGVNVRAPDLRTSKFGFYDRTDGKIIGLLGMDILGKNGTIIDFGQKKLYFYPL